MKFVVLNDELRGRIETCWIALPPGSLKRNVSIFAQHSAYKIPAEYLDKLGIDYSRFELVDDIGNYPDSSAVQEAHKRLMLNAYKHSVPELAAKMSADGLDYKQQPDNLGISRFSVFDVMISTVTFGCFGFAMALNREKPLWQRMSWMVCCSIFGMAVDVTLWALKVRKVK